MLRKYESISPKYVISVVMCNGNGMVVGVVYAVGVVGVVGVVGAVGVVSVPGRGGDC